MSAKDRPIGGRICDSSLTVGNNLLRLSEIAVINGEMLIVIFGLGGLLRMYGSRFDAEKVFAILLVVVGVALACSSVVESMERRVTRWMEPSR